MSQLFKYVIKDNCVIITGFLKVTQNLIIPERVDNYPVTEIRAGAFANAKVKNVENNAIGLTINKEAFKRSALRNWKNTRHGSIKKIGDKAFYECRTLRRFEFSNKEVEIGNSAFRDCKVLKEIKLPETIINCGVNILKGTKFFNCGNGMWGVHNGVIVNYILTSEVLTVPEEVIKIRNGDITKSLEIKTLIVDSSQLTDSCLANSNIEKVIINGDKPIPHSCFQGCKQLKSITLSHDIKRIKADAFKDCILIQRLFLPNSLRVIDKYAFKNCISLHTIRFNNKLITIKEFAFENCATLMDVYLPSSIRNFSYRAFYNCGSLRRIVMHSRQARTRDVNIIKGCPALKELKLS